MFSKLELHCGGGGGSGRGTGSESGSRSCRGNDCCSEVTVVAMIHGAIVGSGVVGVLMRVSWSW